MRSAVHRRQRLCRHPRLRPGGGGIRVASPGHVRRRRLQRAGRRDRGPHDRERKPGQPAQLAGTDLPNQRRRVVSHRRRRTALLSADIRPAARDADPNAAVPRQCGPDHDAGPAAVRVDAPAPRGRHAEHARRRELFEHSRIPLTAGRSRGQHHGRVLPFAVEHPPDRIGDRGDGLRLGDPANPDVAITHRDRGGRAQHRLADDVRADSRYAPVTVEKVATIFTGRDAAISEPASAARQHLEAAGRYADLHHRHARAWARLWEHCHVGLSDNTVAVRVLRLHLVHLLQTISPHPPTSTPGSRPAGCTVRPIGGTSSGTRCSSPRC